MCLAFGETFEALQQGLQGALWGLQLPRALRKLDNFDFLMLDDLGICPKEPRSRRSCSH